jgi:uncharacterized delta-60 repeat protein
MSDTIDTANLSSTTSLTSQQNHSPTFSSGTGIVALDLKQSELGNAVRIQADGKILLAGVRGSGLNSYYYVARFKSDGSLDLSFNGTGTVLTTKFAAPSEKTSIHIQPDGKIILGGNGFVRIDSNGKIDQGFEINSKFVVYSTAQQSDGKFVLAGYGSNTLPGVEKDDYNSMITRFNANGGVDLSLNKTGYLELNLGKNDTIAAMVPQADGQLLLGCRINNEPTLVRVNSDGKLDSTFGVGGKATLVVSDLKALSVDIIKLQNDGKILVAGIEAGKGYLARFLPNGKLDLSFGGTGHVYLDGTSYMLDWIEPSALEVQADGKIILAGGAGYPKDAFVAIRISSDGKLDKTFNQTGTLRLDDTEVLGATGIAIQADGSILFSATKNDDAVMVRVNANGVLDRSLSVSNSVDASVNFDGGSTPVVLDNNAKIYDADLQGKSYQNTRLVLERVGGSNTQDVFSGAGNLVIAEGKVQLKGVVIGSYTQENGRLEIQFTEAANEESVSATLRQIAYKNLNTHATKDVAIAWTFDDGTNTSNSSATSISTVKVLGIANMNAPSSSDSSVIGVEDEDYVFKVSDFVFKDIDSADSLQSITVTGVPTKGGLFKVDSQNRTQREVQVGDVIDVNELVRGKFVYHAPLNANGENLSSFRVRVSDGSDLSPSATISLGVKAVNDLPSGSVELQGHLTAGETLEAKNKVEDADGIGVVNYQWTVDGIAEAGATKSSFALTNSHIGKVISVIASYTDAGGTKEQVSSTVSKPIGGSFQGTIKNDQFTSTERDEIFNGGLGLDTAIYSDKLGNYTIKNRGSHIEVQNKSGVDGTDYLLNMESIKFSDFTLNLGIQSKAAGSKPAEIASLVELYISFFNRIPEADGLSYWISQMQSGRKVSQIADSFFEAGTSFPDLTGYSKSMTDIDFINTIYRNTLGRAGGADQEGLKYWAAELASGNATRGSLVTTILNSAHSFKGDAQWGFVADLLDNKKAVGVKLAVDWGIGYSNDADAIGVGMAIAALITPQSTAQALALIGINSDDLQLY